MFGKKIVVPNDASSSSENARNKFTLVSPAELDDEDLISLSDEIRKEPVSPGAHFANRYEDDDNVNLDNPVIQGEDLSHREAASDVISSQDDLAPKRIITGSPIKKTKQSSADRFDDDDQLLNRASVQVDHLHKSALALEGWLENQVPFMLEISVSS